MSAHAGSVARWIVVVLAAAQGVGVPGRLPLAAHSASRDSLSAERWDLSHPTAHYELPKRLREISGLAFSADGQLFTHEDNKGLVYRIDPVTGDADRGFGLGSDSRPPKGDFEAIAIAGKRFFLVTSRGLLYEFREAAEHASAPYRVTDTHLGMHCEIEGMAYDARTKSLLFACKTLSPHVPEIHIYSLSMDPKRTVLHLLKVPFTALAPFGLGGGVHPSGIEVDPKTGALLLVAARERVFFVLSRDGRVLAAVHLLKKDHRQPEGVTVGPRGNLYISDEAAGHHPTLTVYALRKGGS